MTSYTYNQFFTLLHSKNSVNFLDAYKANTNCLKKMERNCDLINIDGIKIPIEYELDTFTKIIISIGGNLIWGIPFWLIYELSPKIIKTKTHRIIQINPNIFSSDNSFFGIPLISLNYHKVTFDFKSIVDVPYSPIIKGTAICTGQERELFRAAKKYNINEYQEIEFRNTNSITADIRLPCSGFFIQFKNQEKNFKLENIRFTAQDFQLFDYDYDMIQYVGQIIKEYSWTLEHQLALYETLSCILPNEMIYEIEKYITIECLYWIPFVPHKKWNENISGSTLKFNSPIDIRFDKTCSGKIIFMVHNQFFTESGMGWKIYR